MAFELISQKQRFAPEAYHNKFCAIIFVIHMVIVLFSVPLGFVGGGGGGAALLEVEAAGGREAAVIDAVKGVEARALGSLGGMHLFGVGLHVANLPGFVLTALLFAFIFSQLWLVACKFEPVRLTYISLWSFAVLWLTLGAWAFMQGQIINGVMCVLVGLAVIAIFCFDKRLEFTAGMIERVSTLLLSRPEVFAVTFAISVVKILWLFVCLLSLVGKPPVFFIVLLFCFFWSCEVFSNVIHVTAAGWVARWYYDEDQEQPLQKALGHSVTYQFGSICYGSAMVAIIQTIKWLASQFEEDADNDVGAILASVAQCILSCIEELIRLFNYWTFCVIAIWSPEFHEAGAIVCECMEDEDQFLQAISSVCIVDIVCFMANLFVGFLNAVVVMVIALGAGTETGQIVIYALIAFYFGFAINSVGSRVLDSGVGSIFTCMTANRLMAKERDPGLEELVSMYFPCDFRRPKSGRF